MRNLPSGRTARLWLRERLEVAEHGIDVLEQKLHALAAEQRRLTHHRQETGQTWEHAMHEADRWFRRAAVIGGSQQFALVDSQIQQSADATVTWRSTMGVTYPAQVRLRTPDAAEAGALGHSGALTVAATHFQRAATAALEHAAADRALELLETELSVTRRRLRALEHRWKPNLQRTLHDVELSLEEDEREDMVRTRWASERRQEGLR